MTQSTLRPNARRYQYVVMGRGEFPHDMLRYDDADFAALVDQHLAARTMRREIKIIGGQPTEGRWASFGWRVDHIEELARKTAQ